MNPYESPRSIDADLQKQIALAVAQDGTLTGLYWALAGTAIAFSALLALAVLVTRELVPSVFDDFDADIPTLTQLVVSPAFVFAVSFLCLATIAKERMLRNKACCVLWNAVTIVVVLVLAAMYAAAMVLPLVQIGARLQ